jgi:ANTAR domain/GAF domain
VTDKSALLAQWAREIASSLLVQPLPLRLCLACARLLGADGGAITLAYTGSQRVTLCVTDEVAARLEDLQEVLGQGPGPDAYRSGQAVTAELGSAAAVAQWPMFAAAARAAAGGAALYALPIRPEGPVLGVLTLHQLTPRPLNCETAAALFLADALGAALLQDLDGQDELGAGPWASRAQVHQATGMVIAQLGVGADDALALLRAHAYAHDTSVDAIAAQVVGRSLDFTTADAGTGTSEDEQP